MGMDPLDKIGRIVDDGEACPLTRIAEVLGLDKEIDRLVKENVSLRLANASLRNLNSTLRHPTRKSRSTKHTKPKKLIYTVGKTEVYEDYLAKDKHPEKAKGGSVWRTKDDARGYLLKTKQDKTFSVYGIEADWDKDTEPTLEGQWRALTRKAWLIKLKA